MSRAIYLLGYLFPVVESPDIRLLLRFMFDWRKSFGGDIFYNDATHRIEYHMPVNQHTGGGEARMRRAGSKTQRLLAGRVPSVQC